MIEQFTITKEWLQNNKTPNGGYTKKQASILLQNWPLRKGWQNKVIGNKIIIGMKEEFEFYSRREPNKKQVREVLTIDNCIAYLFKNGASIDYIQYGRINRLLTELKNSNLK